MSTSDTATTTPSPAVLDRLKRLGFVGDFSEADAGARNCTLVATEHGAQNAPDHLTLGLMVDGQGIVKDVRFRSAAQGDLLAAYDAMCELVVGKALTDAAKVTPREVDTLLRAGSAEPAIPLALEADKPFYVLQKALERFAPAAPKPADLTAADLKPFADCGLFERVKRIEQVLDAHVRPALASDGGGLDLVDLKTDDLFVQYHGACGSCSSSVGGTLQFIQDSLNNHLAATLVVHVSGMDEESPIHV